MVTKIDVLNKFSEIKAATHYEINGERTEEVPYDLCTVPVKPIWKSYPGWEKSLEGVTDYDDLPDTAKDFLRSLEDQLEVPISMVSTGPARSELIVKKTEVVEA